MTWRKAQKGEPREHAGGDPEAMLAELAELATEVLRLDHGAARLSSLVVAARRLAAELDEGEQSQRIAIVLAARDVAAYAPGESDGRLAQFRLARLFPEIAKRIDAEALGEAVKAYRARRNHFPAFARAASSAGLGHTDVESYRRLWERYATHLRRMRNEAQKELPLEVDQLRTRGLSAPVYRVRECDVTSAPCNGAQHGSRGRGANPSRKTIAPGSSGSLRSEARPKR